ncbi:hypothetical protein DPMN_089432 [Dreissena polymorpha]|uniref:SRCR domain-containing protein n=1 Tax=Dreissena polymorpha TaxID=45954 RepID=A0A9D4KVY9_DREPO|nr:hypothetical protein DPMN_089432 [Dreissena polymorpha]
MHDKVLSFLPSPAKAFQTSLHEGTGPIFIDNMVCGVNNSNINECHYDTFDNCNHSKDMAVTCTGPLDIMY